MSASDHANKHIAHEVMEWVHNGEERWGKEIVAKHNESRFLYNIVRTIVTKGDASRPKLINEKSVEQHFWIDPKWEPLAGLEGQCKQRLEDMFGDLVQDSYCDEDKIIAYQHLSSLPETLHILFHRTASIDERDDDGCRKQITVTRPIDVPHKIDFGKGGFRKALYPPNADNCKKYKLAGAVVGKLLDPSGGDNLSMTWWGYVYNPDLGQWFKIGHPLGAEAVETAEVHMHTNSVERDGTPTNTFPLRLYYQVDRDLSKVFAKAPAPDHDAKFWDFNQLLGGVKTLPKRLREGRPHVLVGRVVFDVYYTRVLTNYCLSVNEQLVTREDLDELAKWIECLWQELDLSTRSKWINNAARINLKVEGLTKFRGISVQDLFKEQWILAMIHASGKPPPGPNEQAAHKKRVSDRVCWLHEEGYFAELWKMMGTHHKGIFQKMTKERNYCKGSDITGEQGMMEIWETYKRPLVAFLIPGGLSWKKEAAQLLDKKSTTYKELREFFIDPLPTWRRRMDEQALKDEERPEFMEKLRKACSDESWPVEAKEQMFWAAKQACEAISAQENTEEQEKQASPKPTSKRKREPSLKRQQEPEQLIATQASDADEGEQWTFRFRCMGCRRMRSIPVKDPSPGQLFNAKCVDCCAVTEVQVPDQAYMDASETLSRYSEVIRARLDLKRLKQEAWEREDAKREAGRAAARAAQREAQRQADEARARIDRAAREAASEQWRRERDAKMAEEKRIFEERAAKAKAEHEAREAERIAKAREARAEAARKKAAAEAEKKKEEQLAEVARLEKAKAERAAREAAKADEKQKKKAAREKAANIFKEEEERKKRHSAEVAQQEADAKAAAKAKEEADRQAAIEERERKRVIQAEEEAKTAEAEARAAARAAVRQAERKVEANNQLYVKLASDDAIDQEAEWLLKEAIAAVAAEKVATEAAAIVVEVAAASPRLSSSSPSSSSSSPIGPSRDWMGAATKVQDVMREVVEAQLSLREAEDTAKAMKASLESAGMTPPAPKPVPEEPQWQPAPKKKQQPVPKPKPTPPDPAPQHHDEAPSSAPIKGTHYVRGKKVCWYFGRGTCRNGDACPYLHIRNEEEANTQPKPKNKGKAKDEPKPEPKAKPKPEPKPKPEDDANNNCVVCFEGVKDHLCMPCKHLCVCSECAGVIERLKACPICREPIVDIFKVFA